MDSDNLSGASRMERKQHEKEMGKIITARGIILREKKSAMNTKKAQCLSRFGVKMHFAFKLN